jgi:hypothetical protein
VPLWRADDVEGAGMRTRQIAPIEARVRYVRLRAEGGDEAYSVGELELFASAADLEVTAPKKAPPKPPEPPQGGNNTTWIVVVVAGVLVFLFVRRKAPAEELASAEAPKADEPPKVDEPPKS